MLLDLLLFLPLAVLTNTLFPIPFDPVLLFFASRHSFQSSLWFAIIGSICAGLAGRLDIKMGRTLDKTGWLHWLPLWRGHWFYLGVLVFAFAPLPFSVVRLAAMRAQPCPAFYGLTIMLGRLPRYLLIIYFCQSWAVPLWLSTLVMLGALLFASFHIATRSHRRDAGREKKLGTVPSASYNSHIFQHIFLARRDCPQFFLTTADPKELLGAMKG